MADAPLIEVTLPAPVEEVWAHLREPDRIARWFGWEYEGLAEEIAFIFGGPPEGTPLPEGAGLEVDDGAHVFEIRYGGDQVDRFTLEPAGAGTILRLTRTVPADAWDGVYDDIGEGWISFVQQLRFLLERHPGEDRRTVYLSSPVTVDGGAEALAALTEDGEPWYRTERQSGTIDANGHLVLVTRPRDAAWLTVTAFGLADAEAAALEARWTSWWTEHVGATEAGDTD